MSWEHIRSGSCHTSSQVPSFEKFAILQLRGKRVLTHCTNGFPWHSHCHLTLTSKTLHILGALCRGNRHQCVTPIAEAMGKFLRAAKLLLTAVCHTQCCPFLLLGHGTDGHYSHDTWHCHLRWSLIGPHCHSSSQPSKPVLTMDWEKKSILSCYPESTGRYQMSILELN